MSETLVIRLRTPEAAPASWMVVDANGARSGPVQSGPLVDALSLSRERRAVLLIPAGDVTLAAPELPMRGGAKLALAVPFALEEQLASDVDTLHFAVGARAPGAAGTPVAVVARSLMDRWLAACDSAGLNPDAAYAESSFVPETAGGWTLLLDEDVLMVRHADALPYVLDASELSASLDLVFERSGDTAGSVTCYASPQDYERWRETIEGLRTRASSLQVKLLPDGALPLLAAQCARGGAINLLQGPYAARSSLATGVRRWRVPAALAAATALVFIATQVLSMWQLHRAERQLDAEIAQVFAQALPGQKAVDPRAQMQGVLGLGEGRSALLPAVSALAKALAGTPNARLESINCRGGTVDVRLTMPSVSSLDGVRGALGSQGLDAEIQSATPRGDVVDGRLVVRLPAT